jgi:class 3 adenylate cyclase
MSTEKPEPTSLQTRASPLVWSGQAASDLPSGTVTFLFTDIEGSTRLWEQHPEAMRTAVARHVAILHEVMQDCDGRVFRSVGDGLCAAFAVAHPALHAALQTQLALQAEPWKETGPLRVRVALHTGAVEVHRGDYLGPCLNRLGRLLPLGHGGQVLLTQATAILVRDALPPRAGLRDLGEHRLRDLVRPERIFQLVHPDLAADFPPLGSPSALPHSSPNRLPGLVGDGHQLVEVRWLVSKLRRWRF